MSADDDADRHARVALSTISEPGYKRLTDLVAELGAGTVHRPIPSARSPTPPASDSGS